MAQNSEKLTREEKKQAKIAEKQKKQEEAMKARQAKWGQILFKAIEDSNLQLVDSTIKKHPEALDYTPVFKHVDVGYYTYRQVGRDDYDEEWHDQGSYDVLDSALLRAVKCGNRNMFDHILSLEDHGVQLKLDDRAFAYKELDITNERSDAEIIKILYERGRIGEEAAVARAINTMEKWYVTEGYALNMLLDNPNFKLPTTGINEFLRQAFRFKEASRILNRADLQLESKGTKELLMTAVSKGKPEEISMLLDRFDFVFPAKTAFTGNRGDLKDHADYVNELFNRILKGEDLVDVTLKILENKETSLESRGFNLLTTSMDIPDNRIFNALTKRADIVLSVIRQEDNGVLKSLLSKTNLNLDYDDGIILQEALLKNINAENIKLMLENTTLRYEDDKLDRGLGGAAHQKRFDVIRVVLDKITKEIPNVVDGSLLATCLDKESFTDEDRDLFEKILNRKEFSFERITSELSERESTEVIGSIIHRASRDEKVIRSIIERSDFDLRKYGHAVLDGALTYKFENFAQDLFNRGDFRLGENVGELIKKAKGQLPDSNLSELIFKRREQELEKGEDAIVKTFDDIDNEDTLDKIED